MCVCPNCGVAGAVVALWLLTPSTHDLTGALQLSSTFLQAQRALGPEAVAGYTGTLPTYSLLNLKDVRLTDTGLERYPWLKEGPTDHAADLVQVGLLKVASGCSVFLTGKGFEGHTYIVVLVLLLLWCWHWSCNQLEYRSKPLPKVSRGRPPQVVRAAARRLSPCFALRELAASAGDVTPDSESWQVLICYVLVYHHGRAASTWVVTT